ncbi:hypothetical protein AUC71_02290 [Methyloceanibacter marginalis]|uniref:Uncharacterized protein n=1 Tax=Methyloceanibacter marginalis TaxID=1774971 RepID=A0A1E3W8I0_9HYPH|nr:hypothetical protein AUC71_02290 [Methyloceanibacter marginalis]
MMRGEPAGDQVIAGVGEGQVAGLCLRGDHVSESALFRKLARLLQHLRRDVAGGDLGDFRREGERGVAGAGGDVEMPPGRFVSTSSVSRASEGPVACTAEAA